MPPRKRDSAQREGISESTRRGARLRQGSGGSAEAREISSERRLEGPGASAKKLAWSYEEWDVALADGAIYRIFRDCDTDGWFIDAIVD